MEDRASILQCELDELRPQIASLEGDLEDMPDYALGEGDPSITRWEVDQALLKRLREQVVDVEQALSATTADAYGKCELSSAVGQSIPTGWQFFLAPRCASAVHGPVRKIIRPSIQWWRKGVDYVERERENLITEGGEFTGASCVATRRITE